MDYTSKTRSLQSLVKDMNKGIINLSHKLQRPEGQWNRKQRTDLIDSLLRHYPINPTYAIVEDDGILSIIDGVQRLSTIRDYIDNVFALFSWKIHNMLPIPLSLYILLQINHHQLHKVI